MTMTTTPTSADEVPRRDLPGWGRSWARRAGETARARCRSPAPRIRRSASRSVRRWCRSWPRCQAALSGGATPAARHAALGLIGTAGSASSRATDLWEGGAAGVLVVLLYNQSKDLAYYTYDDLPPGHGDRSCRIARAAVGPGRRLASAADAPGPSRPSIEAIDPRSRSCSTSAGPVETLRKPGSPKCPTGARRRPVQRSGNPVRCRDAAELVFALASCQYPSVDASKSAVAGASYARLGTWLTERTEPVPQCLLLVGDQIYVDGTAGLFDPTSQFDRFVRPYEILFRMNAGARRAAAAAGLHDAGRPRDLRQLGAAGRRRAPRSGDDRGPSLVFQVPATRGARLGRIRREIRAIRSGIQFRVNGFPLFMADTRTERDGAHCANGSPRARIMSKTQMGALLRLAPRASRATCRRSSLACDPAPSARPRDPAGRRGERAALRRLGRLSAHRSTQVLACIAEAQIPNVVFVSGDEHLSCVARVELETKRPPAGHRPLGAQLAVVRAVPVREFGPGGSCGRRRLRRPGAASQAEPYKCSVRTVFAPPGRRLRVLRFRRDGSGWNMECCFDRAGASGGRCHADQSQAHVTAARRRAARPRRKLSLDSVGAEHDRERPWQRLEGR